MKKIYFDYAAATPLDPQVKKSMEPYWNEKFGNAGALHSFGQEASAAIFNSRRKIAGLLGADAKEIIFTGSATEANNFVLRGVVKALSQIANSKAQNFQPKIITSSIEHDSILNTCRDLEKQGVEIIYLPVSKQGIIDLNALKKSLDERTALVSVMYANNEMGAIQPISKIAEIISDFRKQIANSKAQSVNDSRLAISHLPLFHTDAAQAFNYLDCDVNKLGVDPHTKRELAPSAQDLNYSRYGVGVDLMTLSCQKIYGPKGVGALFARQQIANSKWQMVGDKSENRKQERFAISDLPLAPIITGGEQQEIGLRGGTENTPGIAGFARAAEIAANLREKQSKRLGELQKYLWDKIKKQIRGVELNGPEIGGKRLPNNINLYFPGTDMHDLVIQLDMKGFAVSAGAACTARVCKESHVLEAMGYKKERAMGLRIAMGRQTTKKDIDKLLEAVKNII